MEAGSRPSLSPDAIVEAAEQMISATGSTEWTVRSLSRILECAPGALYRHFPGGAAEIAAEIRERDFARLAAALDAAEADPSAPGLACLKADSLAARLVRRCHAYLDFAAENAAVYQHLFGPLRGGLKPRPSARIEDAMVARPAALIRRAAQTRELNRPVIGEAEARRIAAFLWIQLHGFADLRLSGLAGDDLDALRIRLLVGLLNIAGFAVAATPAGLEAAAAAALRQNARAAAQALSATPDARNGDDAGETDRPPAPSPGEARAAPRPARKIGVR